jgi:hypothetical protein
MRNLIKVISLIVRKSELSREQFAEHYEQIHVPLALRSLDGFRGYTRNYLGELIVGAPATFDCASEFWYADRAAIDRTMKFMASAESQALHDDELSFMDRPRNTFFPVAETLILGDPTRFGEAGAYKFMAFLDFTLDGEIDDFERRIETQIQRMTGLLRCVQNRSLGQAVFGCIAEFWFRDREFGEKAMVQLNTGAKRNTVVSVREIETQC